MIVPYNTPHLGYKFSFLSPPCEHKFQLEKAMAFNYTTTVRNLFPYPFLSLITDVNIRSYYI